MKAYVFGLLIGLMSIIKIHFYVYREFDTTIVVSRVNDGTHWIPSQMQLQD